VQRGIAERFARALRAGVAGGLAMIPFAAAFRARGESRAA